MFCWYSAAPQSSVLRALLFNIYINDLLFLTEFTDVCNDAADITFLAWDSDLKHLMERVEHDTKLANEWFEKNYMKLNESKCEFIVAGHRYQAFLANIRETKIWEGKNKKFIGLTIDRNLNFDDHVFSLCNKAGRKLSALFRISNYISFWKTRILLKTFVESQLDIAH